jgi:RNA polymerase sigma-70 factor (ECF subfamily)
VEQSERELQVQQALETLPEFLRSAVALVYFQGLKYREAAEVLSVPVGTVKSRVHTAIMKLAEFWKESPVKPR